MDKCFMDRLWSRRLVVVIASCAALQACLASPSSQLSGKYCLDGMDDSSSAEQFSCLYLEPDGKAAVKMFGVLTDAQWQFLEQNRIKLVNQSTGTGLTLDVSPDQSELVGLLGFVRYVKHQSAKPSHQPLPSASHPPPLGPQSPKPFSSPSPAAPLLGAAGFLVVASLLVGLFVLIRRQGDDDF